MRILSCLLLFLACLPAWASPPVLLRFVQLSDVHFVENAPDVTWRLMANAPDLLKDALKQINALNPAPKFMVLSGDFVHKNDETTLRRFFATLSENTPLPTYLALGTRESGPGKARVKLLAKTLNNRGFSPTGFYHFTPNPDTGVWVLDSSSPDGQTAQGQLGKAQFKWLTDSLKTSKHPMALFILHHPVIEPYASPAQRMLEPDRTQLLTLLEKHPATVAVISGGYHVARVTQRNGIIHASAPALIEYPNAFRVFTLYANGTWAIEDRPVSLDALRQKSRGRSPWLSLLGSEHTWSGSMRAGL
jgi:Icc protein